MVGEEAWSVLAGGWRWREPEVADYSVLVQQESVSLEVGLGYSPQGLRQ